MITMMMMRRKRMVKIKIRKQEAQEKKDHNHWREYLNNVRDNKKKPRQCKKPKKLHFNRRYSFKAKMLVEYFIPKRVLKLRECKIRIK